MKILVLGDSGLLGQAAVAWAAYNGSHNVLGISSSPFAGSACWGELRGQYQHSVLSVPEQWDAYRRLTDSFKPEIVLNAAALADLKDCEENLFKAKRLNAELPGLLAADCRERGAGFMHVSTDQVFDGKKTLPYTEEDSANPQHVYGKTKRDGEQAVLDLKSGALVIRTNIVGFRGRAGKPTFAEWICESLAASKPMTLFTDYYVSSVYVGDFVKNAFALAEKKLTGLWHAASHDFVSKYEFGAVLAKELGFGLSQVQRGRLQDLNLIPPRPAFLAMSSARAEQALGRKFFSTGETLRALALDFKLRQGEKNYAGH